MVEHDLDHDRHQLSHQRRAVADLVAIDRTLPRRATVHELVAQRVDAGQHHAQHRHRIALPQGRMSRPVGGVEVRELLQEGPEGGLLGEPIPPVLVTPAGQLLRAMEPAQRPVDPQGEVRVMCVALGRAASDRPTQDLRHACLPARSRRLPARERVRGQAQRDGQARVPSLRSTAWFQESCCDDVTNELGQHVPGGPRTIERGLGPLRILPRQPRSPDLTLHIASPRVDWLFAG